MAVKDKRKNTSMQKFMNTVNSLEANKQKADKELAEINKNKYSNVLETKTDIKLESKIPTISIESINKEFDLSNGTKNKQIKQDDELTVNLQTEIKNLYKEKSDLIDQLDLHISKTKNLEETNKKLENEIVKYQKQIAELQLQITVLKNEINELNKKIPNQKNISKNSSDIQSKSVFYYSKNNGYTTWN